jgi:hypothetical protein
MSVLALPHPFQSGDVGNADAYKSGMETEGTNNLKQVMCLDGVDFTRTYSNNCVEIFNVLGIEAARAANAGNHERTLQCHRIRWFIRQLSTSSTPLRPDDTMQLSNGYHPTWHQSLSIAPIPEPLPEPSCFQYKANLLCVHVISVTICGYVQYRLGLVC